MLKKHQRGKKVTYSLICALVFFIAFCAFAWLRLCAFLGFLCFLWVWNLFVKKIIINKEFKTALKTSFTLLLQSESSKLVQVFFKSKSNRSWNHSKSIKVVKVLLGLLENSMIFLMKVKHSAFLFKIIFLKKLLWETCCKKYAYNEGTFLRK